jgi:uncharacterized membrane protein YuzA (DUF378 family)
MFSQQTITLLVQAILIVAALNWALVAYNGMDLVAIATGGGVMEKYAKYAVGVVAIFAAYQTYLAYSR